MLEIVASFLLYAGMVSVWFAPWPGLGLIVVALALPSRLERVAVVRTDQDAWMPEWQFGEVHQAFVAASVSETFHAILETTPAEILFYQTLTAIRRGFRRSGAPNILDAAADRPLLESAEMGGFQRLAQIENQEVVEGAEIAAGVRATMNFTLDETPGGVWLRTETRVFAGNPRSVRLFALYWRLIYPGSSLIRYMWLRAIRRRAVRA